MGTYMITGATGGIGASIAESLAARGHDLLLVGRSADRLAKTATDLGSGAAAKTQTFDPAAPASVAPAPRIRTLVLDLSEPPRIEAALVEAGLPDRLDGVVHSAGVVELGRVAEMEADEWAEQLMVNLVAPAELTRLLLPALRAARGQVVFINSGSGLHANPGWSAYAASKHGLRALADSLRAEEPDLRVISVYPGRTGTDMQRKVRAQENAAYEPGSYIEPATVARVVVNALETPRDAVVTDLTLRRQSAV
ncbi:SDR family oxidoreductase [Actinomadura sp. HBU206391]|uniref:SDR family oxidoreductase n=1 Tax=Actinomadura sp. HBU206391 TaxID=2731692 RepID=UPI00164F8B2B|nr:SDR family oxidoreductase [Actinomadura sp. HBU206391]MBC6457414.1 SDR family oxidoreductase [Actinomadura sp. HBU206391]